MLIEHDITKFAWSANPFRIGNVIPPKDATVCYHIFDENDIELMTSFIWNVASHTFRSNSMAAKIVAKWDI